VSAPAALHALLEALEASDARARRRAADELAALARDDPAAREALRSRLDDGPIQARFGVAFALYQLEPSSPQLLPTLIEALGLTDRDLRWQAAEMLSALGRQQVEIATALIRLARADELPMRRRMALFALRDLVPQRPEIEAIFLEALDDPAGDVQRAALACLGKVPAASRTAVDRSLAIARRHRDVRMRRIAVAILPALAGSAARAELRALLQELEDRDDPQMARATRRLRSQC
jgi:HEAT repeat protein